MSNYEMNKLEIGQEIETSIVAITNECVFLDLNSKSEGVLDTAELLDKDGKMTVSENDKIKVFFLGYINGEMRFTTKIAGEKADKSMLENAYKNGIPVEGKVEKEIKGGFEVKIGEVRGFCPYSQMGFKQKEEPSSYVGKVLPFKISEFKENGRNILVSNRAILEAENQEKMDALKKTLQVGMKVKGTVISLQKYGAFVDVNGFQALLPISEVTRARIDDLATVLHEGQEIQAEIIKIDWNTERVSLSTKSLEKDPWDEVADKYSAGDKLDLKISRIADFGLFLEVESGIDGLLHISEIEDVQANTNLRKAFTVGQTLSVIIKQIDVDGHRISLMQASSKEEDTSAAEFLKAQDDSDTYNPFAALLKK